MGRKESGWVETTFPEFKHGTSHSRSFRSGEYELIVCRPDHRKVPTDEDVLINIHKRGSQEKDVTWLRSKRRAKWKIKDQLNEDGLPKFDGLRRVLKSLK